MNRHAVARFGLHTLTLGALLGLAACAGPAVPHWQSDAQAAQQLAINAELEGNQRVALVEWRRARLALSSTAQPALIARLELSRCAAQQASLDTQACAAYEAVAQDAAPAEQAYSRYLAAHSQPGDAALLPPQHQTVALALQTALTEPVSGSWAERLQQVNDPLSRLVAASVVLRAGQADSQVVQLAVDTASAQGWRRPLLAWLPVQARQTEQTGQMDLMPQIERRRQLLLR